MNNICYGERYEEGANEEEKRRKKRQFVNFITNMLVPPFSISNSAAVHRGPWLITGIDATRVSKPEETIDLRVIYWTFQGRILSTKLPNDLRAS